MGLVSLELFHPTYMDLQLHLELVTEPIVVLYVLSPLETLGLEMMVPNKLHAVHDSAEFSNLLVQRGEDD